MSIWNPPGVADHPTGNTLRSVPVTDASAEALGVVPSPLLTSAGRGVYGGVPHGTLRQGEANEQSRRYRLRPGMLARLRAATDAALGR